ncbi:MAG: FtsX-like permease family protein [Acidobacteriota bacterium]
MGLTKSTGPPEPNPARSSSGSLNLFFPLYIALRYTLSPRRDAFIALLSTLSLLGVAVGVVALLVALALMTGFQEDVQERLLGANAHLTVFGGWGGRPITGVDAKLRLLEGLEHVQAVGPVVLEKGLLLSELNRSGQPVFLKGIDPQRGAAVTQLGEDLIEGDLASLAARADSAEEGVVLGNKLAYHLGVALGDRVELIVPQPDVTPFRLRPRSRHFRVVGLIEAGFFDYDSTRCYIGLGAARRLFNLGADATALEIRVRDLGQLEGAQEQVEAALGPGFEVTNLIEMNRPFFSALRLEKLMLFIAVGLILMVAGLNIVSTLLLAVKDKTRDLGTLRALGATRRQIMQIFLIHGLLIGVLGTAIGCLVGVALCWWLDSSQVFSLDTQVYYLPFVPFKLRLKELCSVASLAVVLSLIAALVPAWRASRLLPVEALRYE